MSAKHIILLALFIPTISFSQTTVTPAIRNEEELILMLVKTPEQSKSLLRIQSHLVTKDLWDKCMKEAGNLYDADEYLKSLSMYEVAKEIAGQLNDQTRWSHTIHQIGRVYYALGNLPKAIELYLEAKHTIEKTSSSKDIVHILNDLAKAHKSQGDYERAKEYLRQSLPSAKALRDDKAIAEALATLGSISAWQGDHKQALDSLQESLALFETLNQRVDVADVLAEMGRVYRSTGNYRQAVSHYDQALAILRPLEKRRSKLRVLTGLGILHSDQGDHMKAISYYKESLQISEELQDQKGIAANLINLGVHQQEYSPEEAAKNLQRGLMIAQDIKSTALMITAQAELGHLSQVNGKYEAALAYLSKALIVADENKYQPRKAVLLLQISELYRAKKEFPKALEYADRAATIANEISSPTISYKALTTKGKTYYSQRDYARASEALSEAIMRIEQARNKVAGGEQAQQVFFRDKVDPYHLMTALLTEQNKPEEALDYAEQAKARVLLDVLHKGRLEVAKVMTGAEQQQEKRLSNEVTSLKAEIQRQAGQPQTDEKRLAELKETMETARLNYEAFRLSIYSKNPKLRISEGLVPSFKMEDAEPLISDNMTTLLEYVVTDEQTILFVLTKNPVKSSKVEVKVYRIDVNKDVLSNLVRKYRKLLADNDPSFRVSGRHLYNLLVKPAEHHLRGKTTVCIVPDGTLWELPFQALETDSNKYLLELHAIYYAPSLQVLREMKKRATTLQSLPMKSGTHHVPAPGSEGEVIPQLFAVGFPKPGGESVARARTLRNTPFYSLPETGIEVKTIGSDVYGPRASRVHVEHAAREDTIKSEMGRYRVLHFATHGVFDDHDPLYSYLLLAPGGATKEDGLLHGWELMEMNLHAEMVILSACDTARGEVSSGEGLIGMTWALFVAGVPTTVASQWKIPSETTTSLMVAFHRNANGKAGRRLSKAEAWRQAALAMIKNPKYRQKPFHWAGFVVVGAGS